MLKKLFSHTAIYGLAPQITKIAGFFSLPLITQELTDLDYGVAGVLAAYTMAIEALATLGLRVVLVNYFFKSPCQYKWAWRQIYGFLSLWSVIYASLMGFLVYSIVPLEARENDITIVLLNTIPIVLFGQTATICSTYYQLSLQPVKIVTRSVLFGMATIALNVLFIVHYKMGYMGWFWSTCLIKVATNISYFYPLNFQLNFKPIFNFKRRFIRNSLKVGLPMIPHFYSTYLLNSSDKMVMDVVNINTSSVGKYNVAYTVARFINSMGNASGKAISPLLNGYYKKDADEEAKNLVFILQIIFLIGSFTLSIWMKELFKILIRNEGLSQMYYLGIILVMAYCYRPMYYGANAKLMYAEKTNVIWRVTLIGGLLNVALNFILMPVFGFEIAAITTFIGYLYMGYAGFYFKIFKEINSANYYPLFWIFITIILTVAAYYLVELNWMIKSAVSFMSLAILGYVISRFNKILNESRRKN